MKKSELRKIIKETIKNFKKGRIPLLEDVEEFKKYCCRYKWCCIWLDGDPEISYLGIQDNDDFTNKIPTPVKHLYRQYIDQGGKPIMSNKPMKRAPFSNRGGVNEQGVGFKDPGPGDKVRHPSKGPKTWGCMVPESVDYDPTATLDCSGNALPDPNNPYSGDWSCCDFMLTDPYDMPTAPNKGFSQDTRRRNRIKPRKHRN